MAGADQVGEELVPHQIHPDCAEIHDKLPLYGGRDAATLTAS